jgi:methylmalonyl-CoA/ethylmalonyl-CoA epimerase
MKFHHIGHATVNIKRSICIFEQMGFVADKVIHDENQNVNICFVRKEGHPDIELVEPANDTSPVQNILNKVGTGPYHFCYTTEDIMQEIEKLKQNRFIIVVKPVKASAFNSKRISFCYNKDFGLIEIVEA